MRKSHWDRTGHNGSFYYQATGYTRSKMMEARMFGKTRRGTAGSEIALMVGLVAILALVR